MLLDYLPDIFKDVTAFNEITDAEDVEVDALKESILDYLDQKFLEDATWGLAYWERELGLQVNPISLTYAERRSIIKAKLRGTGKVDAELIKEVVDAWTNGDSEVTFDGQINIKFNGAFGIPTSIDDVKDAVEDVKPAHLSVAYLFAYYLISEVEEMTISELETITLDKFAGGE